MTIHDKFAEAQKLVKSPGMKHLGLALLCVLVVALVWNNREWLADGMNALMEKLSPVEGLTGSELVVEDTTNEVPKQAETKAPKKVTFKEEKKALTADDLLPKSSDASASLWAKVNPVGEASLKDKNFLVGVDTQGSSLRNANLQLRADPPNPRKAVSPWMNSTIEQDPNRKSLC